MQLTTQQLEYFNGQDTILVVSKYPYKSNPASHHGVATYTRDILKALAKKTSKRFVVLVEDTFTTKTYQDTKNIVVVPAFSSGYFHPVQIIKLISLFSQIKIVHLHSEFITSGNPIQMALLIPLLAALKVLRKEVYFTAHNVIDDFGFIASHLGKKRQDLMLKTLEKLMPWYYRCLALLVKQVIALDSSVEKRLNTFLPKNKLYTSPLWINPVVVTDQEKNTWRKKMGYGKDDFVIMCFGFMTKYKGVDWLIQAVEFANKHLKGKKIKLILAGGKAASMRGKTHYESFYNQLAQKVAASPHMILTGFIPHDQLKHYFAVTDLAVLPYRGILGASSSWGQALAHGTPFMLSEDIGPYLQSEDILSLLGTTEIKINDLLFKRNKRNFANTIENLIENKPRLQTMAAISKKIAEYRSPQQSINRELSDLYTAQGSFISLQLQSVKDKLAFLQN